MNRLVTYFLLLPALIIAAFLGGLFLVAPGNVAELAANSVDIHMVQPWQVGITLLALAAGLLIATIYSVKEARHQVHGVQQGA